MSNSIETRDKPGFFQTGDHDKDACRDIDDVEEDDKAGGDADVNIDGVRVSTHLYVGPVHSSQTMDKEVVLRRIRQRKRVNKVRAALHSFVGIPPPVKKAAPPRSNRDPAKKWIDDAFAAP